MSQTKCALQNLSTSWCEFRANRNPGRNAACQHPLRDDIVARTSRTPKPQRKRAILNLSMPLRKFRATPKRGPQCLMPAPAVGRLSGTHFVNVHASEEMCHSESLPVVPQFPRLPETWAATPHASTRCETQNRQVQLLRANFTAGAVSP